MGDSTCSPCSLFSHGFGSPADVPFPDLVEMFVFLVAGVDDIADVGDGEGGLGNVGGDDEAPWRGGGGGGGGED